MDSIGHNSPNGHKSAQPLSQTVSHSRRTFPLSFHPSFTPTTVHMVKHPAHPSARTLQSSIHNTPTLLAPTLLSCPTHDHLRRPHFPVLLTTKRLPLFTPIWPGYRTPLIGTEISAAAINRMSPAASFSPYITHASGTVWCEAVVWWCL